MYIYCKSSYSALWGGGGGGGFFFLKTLGGGGGGGGLGGGFITSLKTLESVLYTQLQSGKAGKYKKLKVTKLRMKNNCELPVGE